MKKFWIRWSPICKSLAQWLRANSGAGVSTIGDIGRDLGLDDSEYPKLYRCIQYWREKFAEFYKYQEAKGIIQGSPHQKWELAIANFEANWRIQPLFFDKEMEMYLTPNLAEKEAITSQRIIHWLKSGQKVVKEAATFHETLPSMAQPTELMGDLKLLRERVEDGNVPRCTFCGRNIQDNWVACPDCGKPLK